MGRCMGTVCVAEHNGVSVAFGCNRVDGQGGWVRS